MLLQIANMLSAKFIETIIARIATFLIQLMLTKDFNELNFNELDFNEVYNKAVDLAKKIFL